MVKRNTKIIILVPLLSSLHNYLTLLNFLISVHVPKAIETKLMKNRQGKMGNNQFVLSTMSLTQEKDMSKIGFMAHYNLGKISKAKLPQQISNTY